jgi:hypothetical protein
VAEQCSSDADGDRLRLLDAYRGPHFTAVAYGAHATAVLSELDWPTVGAPLKRIIVDTEGNGDRPEGVLADPTGEFARIYGLTRDTLLLIRPDGYLGHIGMRNTADTIRDVVRAITPSNTSASSKRS